MKMNSSEHFSFTIEEMASSWFRDHEHLKALTDLPVWLQNSPTNLDVDPHLYLNPQPECPSAGRLVSSLVSPVERSETRALSPVDAGSSCGPQSWSHTPLQPCLPGFACDLCIPFGEEVEQHSSPYVPEVTSPRLLGVQKTNETRLYTGRPSTGTEHLQAEFVLDMWRGGLDEDFPCLVCGRRCDSVGALQNHLMLSWKRSGDCNVLYKSLYSSAHPHVEPATIEARSQSPQPGPSNPRWAEETRPSPSRKRAREAEEDSEVIVPGQKRARKTKHLETGSDPGSKSKNRKQKKLKRRREERSSSW